jgi:hypothetical protein
MGARCGAWCFFGVVREAQRLACMCAQVLCELPELQSAAAAATWGQLLAALLKCLEQRGEAAEAAGARTLLLLVLSSC